MLKKVLLGVVAALAVLVLGVLALATTKPDSFTVERSATIAAPAAAVFANLNDFRRWAAWSPWEKLDPGMTKTYSGPPQGPGAGYAWHGNDDVGEGKMTIEAVEPNQSVRIGLEFIKPFASSNTTVFKLTPTAGSTDVTWTMTGPSPFISKIMTVFVSMDAMVGKDFERGLADLKRVSESAAPTAAN